MLSNLCLKTDKLTMYLPSGKMTVSWISVVISLSSMIMRFSRIDFNMRFPFQFCNTFFSPIIITICAL